MQVISAPRAIALARRWIRLSTSYVVLTPIVLLAAGIWGVASAPGTGVFGLVALAWFATWFLLIGLTVRSRRLAIDAVPLIAAGDFGAAEDRLSQSLSSFSASRRTTLLSLQQLATLRHAQSRWADAVALTRELLARRRGPREQSIETQSRLMLAEALVELGQLDAAAAELTALMSMPLDLRETLTMTAIRLDYHARRDEPQAMLAHLPQTLAMVELLPPPLLARAHALLAWAAWRVGDEPRRAFLAQRTRLLGDVDALVARRPLLRDALANP
jgi:hypothetical protein